MRNAEYFFGCQRHMAFAVKMCQMFQTCVEPITVVHEQTVLTNDTLICSLGSFFKRISTVLVTLL